MWGFCLAPESLSKRTKVQRCHEIRWLHLCFKYYMILLRYRSPLWNPVEPAQSCHFSLNRLKHQPYQGMYNHIETWYIMVYTQFWKACLLLLLIILLLQVRTTSQENSKTSGHNGTTSTSVSWLICMHSTLWITGLCEHLLTQTNLTINSMGCCSPTPTWPQIFLLQQALCRTFWWLFCRNDNFFCPYFLESYICRPQFEHVWTSPKLPWFVCVSVPSQNKIQRAKFRCESNGGWWLFIFQFNVPSHVHS